MREKGGEMQKTHYQVVFIQGFNIYSYLASPIIILHSYSGWRLGCLSAQIHFLFLTQTYAQAYTQICCLPRKKPYLCQSAPTGWIPLLSKEVELLIFCFAFHWLVVHSLLHQANSQLGSHLTSGSYWVCETNPANRVHLDKWRGNDTSGTRPVPPPSVMFSWVSGSCGAWAGFSLISVSSYDVVAGSLKKIILNKPDFRIWNVTEWNEILHTSWTTRPGWHQRYTVLNTGVFFHWWWVYFMLKVWSFLSSILFYLQHTSTCKNERWKTSLF